MPPCCQRPANLHLSLLWLSIIVQGELNNDADLYHQTISGNYWSNSKERLTISTKSWEIAVNGNTFKLRLCWVCSGYCYRRFVCVHFFLHYHIRSSMLPVLTTCQAKSLMRFWFVILKFKRKTLLSAATTGRKGPTLACMLLLAHLGMVCDYMCVRCCFFFWQPGKKQPGSTFFWLVACSAVFEKYYAGMMVLGLYVVSHDGILLYRCILQLSS